MRNFWIDVDIDGRKTRLSGGPKSKDGGFFMAGSTGSSQGAGTINATGVYDDGVILTGYVADAVFDGSIDLDKWNSRIPDRDGEKRNHEPAARFAARMARDLDPETYYADFTSRKELPAFPTRAEWAIRGPLSTGGMIQRLWETVEVQTVHINKLLERIKMLETP